METLKGLKQDVDNFGRNHVEIPFPATQQESAGRTKTEGDKNLKFMGRMNKSTGKTVLPVESMQPFLSQSGTPGADWEQNTSALESEISKLRSENEQLLKDQERLVDVIKKDNFKLIDILNVSNGVLF